MTEHESDPQDSDKGRGTQDDSASLSQTRSESDEGADEAVDEVGFPDDFDVTYRIFKYDGEWFGEDDHGQFKLNAGSMTPPDPDDYDYEPCGAVLRHSYDRFGEARYCEALAVSNFPDDKHDREYDNYCRNHQTRGAIMDYVKEERAQHLAFAASFETLFEYLDAHKKVLAVEMFDSLMEESEYDFEETYVSKEFDVSDSELFEEIDEATVDFPVPNEHQVRAKSLWFAALNYVQMENIMEEQFRVAAEEEGPDGEPLAMGERTKVVSVTDEGRVIEDKEEHHLNLPLSRIQKDYERHLDVGGVSTDTDEKVSDEEARTWVMAVESDQDTPAPEATADGQNPMASLDTPEE